LRPVPQVVVAQKFSLPDLIFSYARAIFVASIVPIAARSNIV
jgi:hypothetical protein